MAISVHVLSSEQITFLNAGDYCFLTTTCSDCYTMQLAGMFDKDLLANI